jgi:uncharacterized protein (DUF427 family)
MNSRAKTESVWDYPRPPVVRTDSRPIRVAESQHTIAESTRAVRVLETSHPPVFYIPRSDVNVSLLRQNDKSTFCEFKGRAVYWDLIGPRRVASVAWSYPTPSRGYETITDHLAFYPSRVDCFVDEEPVEPQEGDFYGGWITSEIRGPFKGGPGTWAW